MPDTPPLQHFIAQFEQLLARRSDEAALIEEGAILLAQLLATHDWLSAPYRVPHPQHYQQYLLHLDAQARFSVVSFVWGPGQYTPVHNHTVWGLIGMLDGAEIAQPYTLAKDGRPLVSGECVRLECGHVDAVSPTIGDIHRVSNAYDDRTSISIHVYGADIGTTQRTVYTEDGLKKSFVSGYAIPDFSCHV